MTHELLHRQRQTRPSSARLLLRLRHPRCVGGHVPLDRGLITLSLDEVREVPLERACAESGLGEELLTMVVLNLEGERGGVLILTFDEHNGRQLAASLLRCPAAPQSSWSELEIRR